MGKCTLKQRILEAADLYERKSNYEKNRAEKMTNGCSFQIELMQASKFNEGRAKAMREALELIEDYLG